MSQMEVEKPPRYFRKLREGEENDDGAGGSSGMEITVAVGSFMVTIEILQAV